MGAECLSVLLCVPQQDSVARGTGADIKASSVGQPDRYAHYSSSDDDDMTNERLPATVVCEDLAMHMTPVQRRRSRHSSPTPVPATGMTQAELADAIVVCVCVGICLCVVRGAWVLFVRVCVCACGWVCRSLPIDGFAMHNGAIEVMQYRDCCLCL